MADLQMTNEYFFLRQDLFSEESFNMVEIAGHSEESEKFRWIAGQKFIDPPSSFRLILDFTYGDDFPDFFDTTVPVMSRRLVAALQKLEIKNIDVYPVTLINPTSNIENEGYFAINVIGAADAIDWSQSEHLVDQLNIRKATGPISLRPERAPGEKAFRLMGGPGFIVIKQVVAEALQQLDGKAVLLQPLRSYENV